MLALSDKLAADLAHKASEKREMEDNFLQGPPKKRAKQGPLGNDIADMMFGFGDSWPPDRDAVDMVEGLVTNYVKDLAARALQVADLRPNGKLDKECFLYLVRKDRQKFQRVNRLLFANKEIKSAQKVDIKEDN